MVNQNLELAKEIKENFKIKKLNKNDYFLKAGENLKEIGFINSGILRYFYIDFDGNDTTKYFTKENDFVLSFASFAGKKAPFYIQALEECKLLVIKLDKVKELISKNKYWNDIYVSLLEKSYIEKEEREADFLFLDAGKRYLKLKENNPELIKRVQQQYIASFLGITPVSLSRLIKKLSLIK